jgi:RNA polymerase sigma-70 factor, ECF subfamily
VLSSRWQKRGKHVPVEESDLAGASAEIEPNVMLGQLVESLSPDQRLVIMHRFIEQKSIAEIAQELGRSDGAVKQLQLRALEKLREQLGRKL